MNRTETIRMLAILNAAYPTTFKNMGEATRKAQIEIWHFALSDEPAEIVITALKEYILSNQFPPTIAGLKEWIDRIRGGGAEDALLSEAWQAVCGNIRFNDLAEENKIFFGGQTRIDNYGMDPGTVQTVFSGQYRKAIGEIRKRVRVKKAVEQLPNLQVLEVGG